VWLSSKGAIMIASQQDLTKRLLFILHHGLVEIRNLALGEGHEQIADLADALETIPGYLDHWTDDHLEMILFNLRTYEEKYHGRAFDYIAHVERYAPPERF
jgi:hypothetical protein